MSVQWQIEPSSASMATENKIRNIVDQIDMTHIPKDKEFISISIGDPTKFPNLLPSQSVTDAVQKQLLTKKSNGYMVSYGAPEARAAIAKKYSLPHIKCTANDVVIASGCSGALDISICALLDNGDNFLIPKPGFSFYETLASRYGFKCKFYNLLPDQQWQIDVDHLKSLVDDRTKCILINNPSNPCGSVLQRQNLLDVLKVAESHSLPIVSDEIYEGMVYDTGDDEEHRFHSVASLTTRVKVPVLTVSGLSKQYLVPGWRVGWIVVHDPIGAFVRVRTALQKLSTVLLGPNSVVQAAIPSILFETPSSYYTELNGKLKHQGQLMYDQFAGIEGLKPIKARGAMYLMVKIEMDQFKGIKDDIDFANKLLTEQAVLCLPGTIFNMPNYFRAVICPPSHIIREIGKRMKSFCQKYRDHSIGGLVSKL